MSLHKHNTGIRKSISVLSALFLFLSLSACQTAGQKGKIVSDPFPKQMIGHTTFRVFQSGKPEVWLGRVFRNEKSQVPGDTFWNGKILSSGGERREIDYSSEHTASLNARSEKLKVKIKAEHAGKYSFKLILVGLKTHSLTRPVLHSDYRGTKEGKETRFVVSLLQADEIVVKIKDSSGAEITAKAEMDKVFKADGGLKYSKKFKGVILAKDAYIGFILTKPRVSDLKRR